MILRYFPDHTQPDFNIDAPCPVFGWPNMIIHACGSHVAYPEHNGPLSIKCAFGGREIYETEGRSHVVCDTGYLLLNDGQRYSSVIDSENDVEAFCIFFRPGFAREVLTALTTPSATLSDDPGYLCNEPITFLDKIYPHDSILSPFLFALRSAIRVGDMGEEWLEDRFAILIEQLFRRHRSIDEEIARLPAVRHSTRIELYRRLDRARDFLDANLGAKIDQTQAATVACLSLHHFIRLFKHAFRETPHQYLTRKRLERARVLLSTTDLTITQICAEVGFGSLGSFSWLFRRKTGSSPEAYRRMAGSSSMPHDEL